MINVMEVKWRTGRKNGRVIYAIVSEDGTPSDDDFMIGSFDDPEWALAAVRRHNTALAAAQ